jgi:hypothetical protein
MNWLSPEVISDISCFSKKTIIYRPILYMFGDK